MLDSQPAAGASRVAAGRALIPVPVAVAAFRPRNPAKGSPGAQAK